MSLWIIWLIAAGVLLIVELLSNLVAALCLAVGCLVSSVVDLMGFSVYAQIAALIVATILAFIFIAPLAQRIHQKHRANQGSGYNSNMDALIGQRAILHKDVGPEGRLGRLRIDGDYWQAKSHDGRHIPAGTQVEVVGYDSIVLIVEEAE